jgi:hypothetical protein
MRALEPIGWKGGDKHYDGTATFFPPFNMILSHIQQDPTILSVLSVAVPWSCSNARHAKTAIMQVA